MNFLALLKIHFSSRYVSQAWLVNWLRENWEQCSQKCSDDGSFGVRIRIASACVPDYATCKEIPVQRENCGCEVCPPLSTLSIGTIIPWVAKPSKSAIGSVNYADFAGWIKCDGVETCFDGPFKNQHCEDLSGRALIGSFGNYKQLDTYEATLLDHHHPHTHTTQSHSSSHTHKYKHHKFDNGRSCGIGHSWCSKIETAYSSELKIRCQFFYICNLFWRVNSNGSNKLSRIHIICISLCNL